jgi:ketosteroid isomerase-like protein
MSQENVEIVRRAHAAWNEDDLSSLLALLADDFVAVRRHAPLPDPGTWPGSEGLLNVAVEWGEGFDDWTMRADEFIDSGDQVAVRVLHEGVGAGSGALVTGVYWYVWSLRDGKLAAMDICATRAIALEVTEHP